MTQGSFPYKLRYVFCAVLLITLLAIAAPAGAMVITINPGANAIRNAITTVEGSADSSNTIILNPGTYSENGLTVTKTLTLKAAEGHGSSDTFIDGKSAAPRIFTVTGGASVTLTIDNLTLQNGRSENGADGPDGSSTYEHTGGNGGDGGDGGAISSNGPVIITSSMIADCSAGNGGNGGRGDSLASYGQYGGNGGRGGHGGAVYSTNAISITASTITGCSAGNGGNGGRGDDNEIADMANGGLGGYGGRGGAVYSGTTVSVTSSTINGCSAGTGGYGGRGGDTTNNGYENGDGGDGGEGGHGGAISSDGPAILTSSTISNCSAGNGGNGGNGGSGDSWASATNGDGGEGGRGGAVYSGAAVSTTASTITGCSAGNGGNGGNGDPSISWQGYGGRGGRGGAVYSGSTVSITSSTITGCSAGIGGEGGSGSDGASGTGSAVFGSSGGTIRFCRLLNNNAVGHAVYGSINAENNWWGTNSNPSVYVSGADANPWLVLMTNVTPPSITTAQTSVIRALLTTNSDGTDTSVSGHVPDGIPVTFAATGTGFVAPGSATITSGEATATYTPGAAGTEMIRTTIDGNVALTTVTVTSGDSGPATAIAVDPASASTVYAGIDGSGIYRTTDGGGSWTGATTQPTNRHIRALAIHPVTHSTLYTGTYGDGVFRSTDSGVTWTACANTGLANRNVLTLVSDSTGRLYAGTEGSVYTSTDGCDTWMAVNSGLP